MQASEVLDVLAALRSRGLRCWVDGGWGVDGLLGRQTRFHGDLDLVVPRDELGRVQALLTDLGYEVHRSWLPTSLAFRHPAGQEVDLHPVDPTPDGGGDHLRRDRGPRHFGPPVAGTIAGRTVPCASAEQQVQVRQGYAPRPRDVQDLARLAVRFGLQLPAPYAAYSSGPGQCQPEL